MENAVTGSRLWVAHLLLLLLLPELALFGFFTAGAVLASPAELPHRVDLVMVLGGGDGARYARGRELVLTGYSSRLFLSNPTRAERKEMLPGIDVFTDDEPINTWQEAQALRLLMVRKGFRSVLVVSDPPHLLRLRYCLGSAFRGTNMSYTIVASEPLWWNPWRWWGHPTAAFFVDREVPKVWYYVLRYRFGLF
jgi:uncharacterized SAM-binding protein YcdF (DUF218 family)